MDEDQLKGNEKSRSSCEAPSPSTKPQALTAPEAPPGAGPAHLSPFFLPLTRGSLPSSPAGVLAGPRTHQTCPSPRPTLRLLQRFPWPGDDYLEGTGARPQLRPGLQPCRLFCFYGQVQWSPRLAHLPACRISGSHHLTCSLPGVAPSTGAAETPEGIVSS